MKDLTPLPMGQLLLLAFRWFDDSLLSTLKENGWPELSHSQSLVMAHLLRDPIRISELARRIGVSRQACQKSVRELERVGLVVTCVDPSNASAKLVALTESGKSNIEAAVNAFAEIETALSERIGQSAVSRMRKALQADWGEPIVVKTQRITKP